MNGCFSEAQPSLLLMRSIASSFFSSPALRCARDSDPGELLCDRDMQVMLRCFLSARASISKCTLHMRIHEGDLYLVTMLNDIDTRKLKVKCQNSYLGSGQDLGQYEKSTC
jgi:hypothetical protein